MSTKMGKVAIIVTLLTLISKGTGLIRDAAMAFAYGTSMEMDAFFIAQSILLVITSILFASLNTTFIPVLSEYLSKNNSGETNKFINIIYNVAFLVAIIISIFTIVFSEQLVKIFAPNFDASMVRLSTNILRILLVSLVINILITLNNGLMQNHQRFFLTASIGIPLNSLIFIMLFLYTDLTIVGLCVVYVIGNLLQLLIQVPVIYKFPYKFSFVFDLKDYGTNKIFQLMVPIMIGSSVQQLNVLVDRAIASGLESGSISALNYANILNMFLIGLLAASISSVYYTKMSEYYSNSKKDEFLKLLESAIVVLMIITVPATLGVTTLSVPLIQLLFERGMFDTNSTMITASVLFFYSFSLVGLSIRDVLNRAFYAAKNTTTPMINAGISIVINIFLSLILSRYMGVKGLALATSIAVTISAIQLFITFNMKMHKINWFKILILLVKVSVSSIIMSIFVKFSYNYFYEVLSNNLLATLASIIIGVVIYLIGIYLLKVEEVKLILKRG